MIKYSGITKQDNLNYPRDIDSSEIPIKLPHGRIPHEIFDSKKDIIRNLRDANYITMQSLSPLKKSVSLSELQ